MFIIIPLQAMENHIDFLKKHCRLCGKSLKRNGKVYGKALFEKVLGEKLQVNITNINDDSEVHPEKVCNA